MVGFPPLLREVQFCVLIKGHSRSMSDKVTTVYEVTVALALGPGLPAISTVSGDIFLEAQPVPLLAVCFRPPSAGLAVIHSWTR